MELLNTLIETDKIIDYSDYAEYLPHVLGDQVKNDYITPNIEVIRRDYSAGTGGLYILPFNIGVSSKKHAAVNTFDRNTPTLKWDVYEAIGAPEVTDMWSLIDICEQMLKYQPTLEDGTKMYGTFLDNGMDTSYFGSLNLWYQWHGGNVHYTQYMTELNHTTGEMNFIFEEDSLFKEGLMWYNELYRRGLMDPDSISTARPDQMAKVENGLAMLPGGTSPGWAPTYFEVFPSDCTLFMSFTDRIFGDPGSSIVIFKDSENIETCLKLVDLMADPYEWMKVCFGPEGCMWQEEDGVLSITDAFADWLKQNGSMNGFPMPDGTNFTAFNTPRLFNAGTPLKDYVGVNGGEIPYSPIYWPDAKAITAASENWNAWKKTMEAEDLWDYIEKNDITLHQESAWDGVLEPVPSDAQKIQIASLKDLIVPTCWKMVYAESDAEFEQLWKQMIEEAKILGSDEIYTWFSENYKPNK